jgi:hypothetical protein
MTTSSDNKNLRRESSKTAGNLKLALHVMMQPQINQVRAKLYLVFIVVILLTIAALFWFIYA